MMAGLTILSCKKADISTPTSYLDQWTGEYEGTSHHYSTYPGDTFFVTNDYYKNVLVDVRKSSLDSCLDLTITYDDTLVETRNDLIFSGAGVYFSEWGGGSSYGSLTVAFKPDSLHYDYFQKCGIPCDYGIYFNIKKKSR